MKNIKLIYFIIICLLCSANIANADALVGEISKDEYRNSLPQVIDNKSKLPINDARVSIPSESKFTKTDSNGNFELSISKNEPVILSVQKDGYRPFSLTIKDGHFAKGLKLEMKKLTPFNLVVSDNLMH
ncbi:MAG: carboxypeptidase-like regulatory domain-containing protein, partial [Candidatus Gastranaerophilales bacterium]|nr:carboxypeptidase-like regulatory domain-containing protein [Candidatus Gastranaerophilales bacterium]